MGKQWQWRCVLQQQSESFRNFFNSCPTEATKRDYLYGLHQFMKFCDIKSYDALRDIEVNKLEGKIRDFIFNIQERKLSSSTTDLYCSAVRHFYSMNNVILNWERLYKFKGKKRIVVTTRPYKPEEIKRLLDFSDLRLKCIILLMASAGLRRGAIPDLNYGNLERVEKYNLYKLRVYEGEPEAYTAYCTPECAKHLDEYFQWRTRLGEVFTARTPVIRQEFDINSNMEIQRPKAITVNTISSIMGKVQDASGLRARGQTHGRTEIMQNHGLRQFWDTTVHKAGVDWYISEKLIGHSDPLHSFLLFELQLSLSLSSVAYH
jgi:integrase